MPNYTAQRKQQDKLSLLVLPKSNHMNLPLPFFIQKCRAAVFLRGHWEVARMKLLKKRRKEEKKVIIITSRKYSTYRPTSAQLVYHSLNFFLWGVNALHASPPPTPLLLLIKKYWTLYILDPIYKPIKLIFMHVCAGKPKCAIYKLYNNFAIECWYKYKPLRMLHFSLNYFETWA